jgi:lipopolysaccharide biosynthesis regulator YciM
MLLQPDLLPEQRTEVERELAQDYRRGGMFEESASAFRALAAAGDRIAAEGLRDVLADQGKLSEAAEVQRGLSGGTDDPILAHLLAAQARQEIRVDVDRAIATARAAVGAHERSADALLALAEAEGAAGHREEAKTALAGALEADASAALLAWPAIVALGDAREALALVESRADGAPADAALQLLRGRLMHAVGRNADAAPALQRALDLDTTGEVTLAMRDLLREAGTPGPDELAMRHDLMVAALLRRARPVRCKRCGAEAPVRAWRCTRCGAFESFAQGAA